jgi:hypothetical protein
VGDVTGTRTAPPRPTVDELLRHLADLEGIDDQLALTERRLRDECALSASLRRAVDALLGVTGPAGLLPAVVDALTEWEAATGGTPA